jgi:integrase
MKKTARSVPAFPEQTSETSAIARQMSVYQRKNDMLWIAAWYESGKKKTRAFKDEHTARAFEAERLSLLNKDSARLTLGEVAAVFFRSRPEFHSVTKDTIIWVLSGRDRAGGRHSEAPGEFMRDKYADALSRHDLERLREGFRVRGASNCTINKYQAYIHSILSWGVEQEMIQRNPWRDFKRLPVKKSVISTSLVDVQKVFNNASAWLQWAIKTMYALTIRPGHVELFGLQWTAFDWSSGAVQVQQGKSKRIKSVFPPESYLAEARQRYETDAVAGVLYVCHRGGKRVNSYREAWSAAIAKAEVSYFPMYHIRHVSISEALARGADLAAVAAQAGHSSISTTTNFYGHVIAGAQRRAAALMPSLDGAEVGTV